MSALIATGLVATALLVVGYIAGSELCLPTARHALRTGAADPWRFACRLVAAGEWALIALGASFLLIAEHSWQLFDHGTTGRFLGLAAAALLTGAAVREMSGRWRGRCARIMSTSLDLVLPAYGAQRERYTQLRRDLETGTPVEQRRALQALLAARTGEPDAASATRPH